MRPVDVDAIRERIIDAADRIANSDGRLGSDSWADLNFAQEQLDEALDAWVAERYRQESERS